MPTESKVPNLDALPPDELVKFAERYEGALFLRARELFPDRPKRYVGAARDLGHYARNMSVAWHLRAAGKVQSAVKYEEICDRIYQKLPRYARW